MTEYRVVWCQCPHAYHNKGVLFIEAANEDDAKKIARNHIERTRGIEWFTIFEVAEATKPPEGRVIGQ